MPANIELQEQDIDPRLMEAHGGVREVELIEKGAEKQAPGVQDDIMKKVQPDKPKKKEKGIDREWLTEFCLYTFFLIMFTMMSTYGRTMGEKNYWISHNFRMSIHQGTFADNIGQSLPYDDIHEFADVYEFMNQMFLPLVVVDTTEGGNPIPSAEQNFVLTQNKLLGGFRVTVVRVEEDDCLFEDIPDEFKPCYGDTIDTTNYTLTIDSPDYPDVTELELGYLDSDEAKSGTYAGKVGSYDGSGNVLDFAPNADAYTTLELLKLGDVLARPVRAFIVDWVTLNPNLNLHTVGKLVFECPETGGVIATSQIKTWRFWRYLGSRGNILLFCEVMVVLLVVYYTWEEMLELYTKGWREYCQDWWNLVDWVNLGFLYTTAFYRVHIELNESLRPTFTNWDVYEPYGAYVEAFTFEAYFNAVNGLLLWLKILKYLSVSKKARFIFDMFGKTAGDIFVFLIILFIIWLGFGMAGYLVFASDVNDFRNLSSSVGNLIRYTVTDMDYDAVTSSYRMFGNIYYLIFTLLMLLVLVNVLVAILTDGYTETQAEAKEELRLAKERGEVDILDNFKFSMLLPKRVRSILFNEADKNKDGLLDQHEVAGFLGVDEATAQEIIRRLDADEDGKLNKQEVKELWHSEIRLKKQSRTEAGANAI